MTRQCVVEKTSLKPTRNRMASVTRRRTDAATARTDRATHRNRHFRTMFTALTAL